MKTIKSLILIVFFLCSSSVPTLWAEEKEKKAVLEILNPEYAKLPDINDDVKVTEESSVEDILKKVNFYYSTHEFDKAIALCQEALKKTVDKQLVAEIYFSLSSNYLEKGIEPYLKNKDDTFYKLSIESARKYLDVVPDSWQAFGNIGSVYLNKGDWKQAEFYFSQAEKYMDMNDPNYTSMEFHRRYAEEMCTKR